MTEEDEVWGALGKAAFPGGMIDLGNGMWGYVSPNFFETPMRVVDIKTNEAVPSDEKMTEENEEELPPKEKTPEQALKDVARGGVKSKAERQEKLREATNKLKGKFG